MSETIKANFKVSLTPAVGNKMPMIFGKNESSSTILFFMIVEIGSPIKYKNILFGNYHKCNKIKRISKYSIFSEYASKNTENYGPKNFELTCSDYIVTFRFVATMEYCYARPLSATHRFGILEWHIQICNLQIVQNQWSRREL